MCEFAARSVWTWLIVRQRTHLHISRLFIRLGLDPLPEFATIPPAVCPKGGS
jgi:hypothetical protein